MILFLPFLLVACTSGSGDSTKADSATIAVGDPCSYLDDATIQVLTGPFQTQPVEYPDGSAVCIWSTKNPNTAAENGGTQLTVAPRDAYMSADLVAADYNGLSSADPAPADSAHPADVTGAEDSYILVYDGTTGEPRAAFTARALTANVNLYFTGFTRVADNANVTSITTSLLQNAITHAP
jgi:hypothetical protein